MKFVYKFDSVRKIKEIFEKRAQKELSIIQLEIERKIAEYDAILNLRTQENKRYTKIATASELKFHKSYLAFLKSEMERIRNEIDQLLCKKEEKLQELVQKSKEHKIFNSLEEIHLEKFNAEQNRIEMIGIDEIAAQKFTRNKN